MKVRAQEKADAARLLLENDTLRAAFSHLEDAYLNGWRSSAETDVAERERFYFKLTILREFQADLTTTVQAGRLVEVNHRAKLTR